MLKEKICAMCGDLEAEVTQTKIINEERISGELRTANIHGYNYPVEYFVDDGSINDTRRREYSMMPEKYRSKTGKDFDWNIYGEDMSAVRKIANAFVLNFKEFRKQGRGLYISSKTKGSGKTLLSCCLANEVLKRQKEISLKFIDAKDYIELYTEKYTNSEDKRQSIKECALLILDDLGAEADSKHQWVSATMSRLIEYRYNNYLPTVFTSNFEMNKLPEDSRVIDRIIGNSIPVIMPEVSIRRKQADEKTREFLNSVLCKSDNTDIFDE